jgi:hypothetical protein
MINSDDYVGTALCLRAQMRRVGSACPLLLMYGTLYDDRSERLSGEAIVRLQGAFDRLVPISELALMVDQWHARVDSTAASRTRDNISVTRPAGGRRLYTSVSQTHAKVYIWALPWERVAYLDLDTLLLANIDDVLRVQLSARESLAATNCTGVGGASYFVAGFMVLRPNVKEVPTLVTLTRFARNPWKGRVPVSLGRAAADPKCAHRGLPSFIHV